MLLKIFDDNVSFFGHLHTIISFRYFRIFFAITPLNIVQIKIQFVTRC